MRHLIIASTSTLFGGKYLDYIIEDLKILFKNASTILFIPYARPGGISYEDYTLIAKEKLNTINKEVIGIHEFKNPSEAIHKAEAIFVGGGNTFVLINELYKNHLINKLQFAIQNGTPYLGTSAGSNICGINIKNTNDMPVVYPPSFDALKLIPFNINPHYRDPDPDSKHMGETRTTRIKEFHKYNTPSVLGLREGSWLDVQGASILLKGGLNATIFKQNKLPYEVSSGTELNRLK